MKLIKLPANQLKCMESQGFIELRPYTHANPIVRWLFWKRLETMLKLSASTKDAKRVLDFGAGSGVFMPTLSKNFSEVYSLDINTASLEHVKNFYPLSNVRIIKGYGDTLPFKDNFFDLIFAADVLEHFKNSEHIQKEFKRVLKKNGSIIVSGPTENLFYVLARKFIYKHKKPADHYTNVQEIMKISSSLFKIEKAKILPFLLIPGFKVYKATKI